MTHTDIRQRANIAWSEASELIQQLPPERLTDVVHWLESKSFNGDCLHTNSDALRNCAIVANKEFSPNPSNTNTLLTPIDTYTDRHLHRSTLWDGIESRMLTISDNETN